MSIEEELSNLAPAPEVQIWKRNPLTGELELVLAESGAQHDDRMTVAEICAATEAREASDGGPS